MTNCKKRFRKKVRDGDFESTNRNYETTTSWDSVEDFIEEEIEKAIKKEFKRIQKTRMDMEIFLEKEH